MDFDIYKKGKNQTYSDNKKNYKKEYICIPKDSLKKNDDFRELSKEVQDELNELINKYNPQEILAKTKQSNLIKNLPSPYIVNLKKTSHHKKEEQEDFIEENEVSILVFPKNEIDEQFTPLLEDYKLKQQVKYKKRFNLIVVFSMIFLLFFVMQFMFLFKKIQNTQKYVFALTQNAFSNLENGYSSLKRLNFDSANTHFSLATRQFIDAERSLDNLTPFLNLSVMFLPRIGEKLRSGYYIIQAGSRLSLMAKGIALGIDEILKTDNFTDKLQIAKQVSEEALPLLVESDYILNKIDYSIIPQNKLDIFAKVKNNLPVLKITLTNFSNLADFFTNVLGQKDKKRYLIALQNNSELRPSGGFLGSFVVIDVYKGRITKLQVPSTGSYMLQGSIEKNLKPPQPLTLVAKRWEFQDSNWSADFPTSAKMMQTLYSLGSGSSVDGIIAINLNVVEKLLKILGPIQMNKYNKTLTYKNFWLEIQKAVELEYDKDINKPKQIISDLTPIFIDRILKSDPEKFILILSLIDESLQSRDIQMYFNDSVAQKYVENYGWSGTIKKNIIGDYFYINVANIAGGKTDRVIEQKIFFNSEIQKNGEIINTIRIQRRHNGKPGQDFTGVRNVAYLRFYVPKGSTLLYANGFTIPQKKYFKKVVPNALENPWTKDFESKQKIDKKTKTLISTEFDKTVFANWLMVDPGETKDIIIKYKLPFKFDFKKGFYNIYFQKQSGINSLLYLKIKLPENLMFLNTNDNLFRSKVILNTDKIFTLNLSRK